jgi:hypothetical protein
LNNQCLSSDRETVQQKRDYAYGQICSVDGTVLPGYLLSAVNQEHGIVSHENMPGTSRRLPTIIDYAPVLGCIPKRRVE